MRALHSEIQGSHSVTVSVLTGTSPGADGRRSESAGILATTKEVVAAFEGRTGEGVSHVVLSARTTGTAQTCDR